MLLLWPAFLPAQTAPSGIPEAPQPAASLLAAQTASESTSLLADAQASTPASPPAALPAPQTSGQSAPQTAAPAVQASEPPLELHQPKRILGFMPNFRSVSGGVTPHPLGWSYNFSVATHQALDYSSFIFLGLTSLSAKGFDEHPSLGKGPGGLWAYTWRGFIDKSDGTYLSAFVLPSILHEDTRYYALGSPHRIPTRVLYIISRQAVARTYGGRQTPNIAGLGGKVLTQYISTYYYPPSSEAFGVLAEKFGYSVMRDVGFSTIREFYPDIAAHYIRKHRAKLARQQQQQSRP